MFAEPGSRPVTVARREVAAGVVCRRLVGQDQPLAGDAGNMCQDMTTGRGAGPGRRRWDVSRKEPDISGEGPAARMAARRGAPA